MNATVIEPMDELRKFEPVSNAVVLAALDRAERHRGGTGEGVRMSDLAEHLGFVCGPGTAGGLRPQLDALIDMGALERVKRQGLVRLVLTETGRMQAARARGTVALPESPQHRVWRQTCRMAVERIDGLHEDARQAVQTAARLLDAEQTGSDAWFALAVRLRGALQYLGCATYCAREWPEPDDAHADIEEDAPWYRPARRSTRGWGLSELVALGQTIRRERRANGLTIEALAHKAGMSPARLGRIERGEVKRRNLRVGQVYEVAEALGITIGELLGAAWREA